MTKFTAKNITVLRFTRKLDLQGQCIPPDCHAIVPEHSIPVTFNHDQRTPVGTATMKRKGNKLVADFELTSKMSNTVEAMRLMRQLRPSIEFVVLDAHEHKVLGIRVSGLSLISHSNADPEIKPLGDAVQCASVSTKAGLH